MRFHTFFMELGSRTLIEDIHLRFPQMDVW